MSERPCFPRAAVKDAEAEIEEEAADGSNAGRPGQRRLSVQTGRDVGPAGGEVERQEGWCGDWSDFVLGFQREEMQEAALSKLALLYSDVWPRGRYWREC